MSRYRPWNEVGSGGHGARPLGDSSPTFSDAQRDLQYRILRVVFPMLTAYYAFLAVAHAMVLEEPVRTTMVGVAGATSLINGVLTLVRNREVVRRWTHAAALVVVLLVSGNGVLHLLWTGEAFQSTNMLLTVFGAAVLIVSPWLFALTVLLCAVGMLAAALTAPGDPLWMHYGFAVFGADVMATVIYLARRANHRARFDAERERDRLELDLQKRIGESRESEERYRAVASLSPAAIVVHRDGIVLFANQAAGRLIGAGDETVLVGSRLYDLFDPGDEERIAAWNDSAIEGGSQDGTFETRLRALHGDWPFVELSTQPVDWEGESAAILVATDVTDRRRLEERLEGVG